MALFVAFLRTTAADDHRNDHHQHHHKLRFHHLYPAIVPLFEGRLGDPAADTDPISSLRNGPTFRMDDVWNSAICLIQASGLLYFTVSLPFRVVITLLQGSATLYRKTFISGRSRRVFIDAHAHTPTHPHTHTPTHPHTPTHTHTHSPVALQWTRCLNDGIQFEFECHSSFQRIRTTSFCASTLLWRS